MIRLPILFSALAAMLMMGCGHASGTQTTTSITVFAAASLTDAFTEMATVFESEHPGSNVVFNFAGSNQLTTQIAQGAPADVFASANDVQMTAAVSTGRIDPSDPVTFATNRLIIVYPAANPARIRQPQDLAGEGVLLVLAAPDVPVGRYALDFLDKASGDPAYGPDFKDSVLANLVSSEQNVRAVLTKVALGEADAGLVYASDVMDDLGDRVGRLVIPDEFNTVAVYPIAPLNDSAQRDAAKAFVELVLSPTGQTIMAGHGFSPATAP